MLKKFKMVQTEEKNNSENQENSKSLSQACMEIIELAVIFLIIWHKL